MSAPFLSIIIPAYNEEKRLSVALQQLIDFLSRQPYTAEVLVVENGSQDRTLEIAQGFSQQYPQVRAMHSPKRGKGLAVQKGMLAAQGEYRFMCDADFSMPVEEINRFLPPLVVGKDIVIASREATGAMRYNEPGYRHFIGRIYNFMIRLLALPGLQDTQCGFKCFQGAVAVDLFRLQTLTGWSFDVEILFIAQRRGYQIMEIGVPWYFNPESKIRVMKDSFRMAIDLLRIRLNDFQGRYARS